MKVKVRMVDIDTNKNIVLREIETDNILLQSKCVLAIDGSTTNTGIAILRESDGALYYTISCEREKDESPVHYKVRLKNFVKEILYRNRGIETVYYEEPFIGYAQSAINLLMLRTFIEELIIENEPTFNYIKHIEINNMKWKKLFLHPDKCPAGTELQKQKVREKMLTYLPCLEEVSQDEIDAVAIGFVAAVKMSNNSEDELKSKKAIRPFKYKIRFTGAEYDEVVMQEFYDIYDGPKDILQNGILFTTIGGRVNFDKKVYELMGSDDKVLILKFSSSHHGNLVLEHRIGHLASTYPYLYAIVWRESRKKK